MLSAPCRCHKHTDPCTYVQTKRQQRRKWGWVIVTEQMGFKFRLSVMLCLNKSIISACPCVFQGVCILLCIHDFVDLRYSEMALVLALYVHICMPLCACDKYCSVVFIFLKFLKNSLHAIMADPFGKGSRVHDDAIFT